jgi:alpha-mannosidase
MPGTGDRPRPVHLVGYAHLDPVWLWDWQEGYAENRATLRSAIDRLAEYPEFVFTVTAVQLLAWAEEADPELFDEIRASVGAGRLHLAGGWWMEPDLNVPSGESLVRHGLYGQRWLADRFGAVATVAANPDSFGHPAGLPQLLRGAGLDAYVFTRPGPHELDLGERAFSWTGVDGSTVIACRTHGYSSDAGDVATHLAACVADARDDPVVMVWYGVGNHGGGPTRANLDSLRRLAAAGESTLLCSSPAAYVAALDADALATVDGDLTHHARGCYSAHAGIKQWNRSAENALLTAEKWAAIAHRHTGLRYADGDLRRAWKQLLVNQFHDTLAGSALESAYVDARDQLGEVMSIASRVTNAACGRLAAAADTGADPATQPIVVFNPHAWAVTALVEHEVGGPATRQIMIDDGGHAVPMQQMQSEATVCLDRQRITFVATAPPLGFAVYRLCEGSGVARAYHPSVPGVLDNGIIVARLDPDSGGLTSLRLAGGAELMAAGAHAVAVDDDSDTWGHDVVGFDGVEKPFEVVSMRRVEDGAARQVVRVTSRCGESTLIEDWSLGACDRYVDVLVTLDWRERHRLCKLRFPTRLGGGTVTAETAYGAVRRPADGNEQPMQRWLDVSDGSVGLAIANDGKSGYDARGDADGVDIGITVARGVVYAWHTPATLDPQRSYRWMDQGEHRFRVRLIPHPGDWADGEIPRRAAELNQPLAARLETMHGGRLGGAISFAAVPANVDLVVWKRGEEGGADVVRICETSGVATACTVRIDDREIPSPCVLTRCSRCESPTTRRRRSASSICANGRTASVPLVKR